MAFLQAMRAIGDCCLRAPGDYAETARAYVGRLAEHGASGALITVGLARAVRLGQDPDEILAAVSEVVRSCERSKGVSIRLLVGIDRASPDRAQEHVGVALRHAGSVVGIDLQGVPSAPLSRFADAATKMQASGMIVRVHAGEFEGPRSVWEAIETIGATRVAHGMRAIEDPVLVAELARRGTVLDLALTSNVALRNCASYTDHPLRRLVAAGLRVTLGTDDPAYFHTSIADEYAHARALGLRTHDMRQMRRYNISSMRALSPQTKHGPQPDKSEAV
jgi:adenosine deaminase